MVSGFWSTILSPVPFSTQPRGQHGHLGSRPQLFGIFDLDILAQQRLNISYSKLRGCAFGAPPQLNMTLVARPKPDDKYDEHRVPMTRVQEKDWLSISILTTWDFYFKDNRTADLIIVKLTNFLLFLKTHFNISVKVIECDNEITMVKPRVSK
ncbi:hypothetical protein E4U60_006422 [Claviceps pazoutovae]|uniref:Uncharacterized protein n=1 Tax=Claviceps pazoutovae TaxID=1649127 RepID=A0A9P7MG82_9HYPO|nr:hypothetical protein E4U60_006422 [Claviceps pazoutovae]